MSNPTGVLHVPDLLMFVCDGNLARSPAAELLSRHHADPEGPWRFASCGVRAVRNERVLTGVRTALEESGVPTTGFRSRQATVPMLREASLILTASAPQNGWIVDEAPVLFRHTFLIKQAARLLADLPPAQGPLSYLEQARDRPLPTDEIEDPFRKGARAARTAVQQIDDALQLILPALGAV